MTALPRPLDSEPLSGVAVADAPPRSARPPAVAVLAAPRFRCADSPPELMPKSSRGGAFFPFTAATETGAHVSPPLDGGCPARRSTEYLPSRFDL